MEVTLFLYRLCQKFCPSGFDVFNRNFGTGYAIFKFCIVLEIPNEICFRVYQNVLKYFTIWTRYGIAKKTQVP